MERLDVPGRTIVLGTTPGPQATETRVVQRLAHVRGERCIGDRRVARAMAEQVLRDLGLTDWAVKVSHDNWDANAEGNHPEPENVELCASFNVSEHTVFVDSVLRERESGWRCFVPGM